MNGIWKKTNRIYEGYDEDWGWIKSDFTTWFKYEILKILKDRKVIDSIFIDLENLHEYVLDKSLMEYDFDSGVNGITKKLYDSDKELSEVYKLFLKDLYKQLGFDFYFQSTPTIRVHCPNQKNQHHYPRYHNDCQYGHPPEEMNIWFSLTKNEDSGFCVVDFENSKKWLSEYDYDWDKFTHDAINSKEFNKKGDEISMKVPSKTDSIFIFNSLCVHTNQPRTKDSRVSIDIRINPVEDFKEGYVGKGRMKAEFKPGGNFGYHEKSIKEII